MDIRKLDERADALIAWAAVGNSKAKLYEDFTSQIHEKKLHLEEWIRQCARTYHTDFTLQEICRDFITLTQLDASDIEKQKWSKEHFTWALEEVMRLKALKNLGERFRENVGAAPVLTIASLSDEESSYVTGSKIYGTDNHYKRSTTCETEAATIKADGKFAVQWGNGKHYDFNQFNVDGVDMSWAEMKEAVALWLEQHPERGRPAPEATSRTATSELKRFTDIATQDARLRVQTRPAEGTHIR